MSKPWAVTVAVMGLILAGVTGFTVILAAHVSSLQGQVNTTAGQLTADKRELTAAARAVTAAQARINGNHRDLITCGDLQNLTWSLSGTDSFNGSISGVAGPAPISLPGHCINQ